ncbi:3'-5' exonuclease [Paenibacillus crassostreae]|uniref:DNA polymerase III subunit epsilon n=1 Tax=Paenibacillus crassostreae TaxID=1763538 RepID=A0A167CJ14_9BACL|nr:3'-5' exonuclease [Paenibacillus crassostreae]AOZ91826.1 DNA polymerase III subunit epsilon [Paenibacillus crassostreae]OAB73251.1 DNA polymerase III subunit epsilon [Paenibacillus crassostreae]
MDFVAIDFETANANRSSACSLGLVEVQDGIITSEQVWLIDPEQDFDYRNIQIHGITANMVQGMPTFHELWPTIEPLLQGKQVVAHNASFDMSVLRYCLDQTGVDYPTFQYYCTYLLSKKMLQDMSSYKLNVIAAYYGIALNHHEALDDARACAKILLKLLEQEQHSDPYQLAKAYGCKIGTMLAGGYTPFSAPTQKRAKKPSARSYISTTF